MTAYENIMLSGWYIILALASLSIILYVSGDIASVLSALCIITFLNLK